MAINSTCESCSAPLSFPNEVAGQLISCHQCGKRMIAPSPAVSLDWLSGQQIATDVAWMPPPIQESPADTAGESANPFRAPISASSNAKTGRLAMQVPARFDRWLAATIDDVLGTIAGAVTFGLSMFASPWAFVPGYVAFALYQAYLITTTGRTVGKRLMSLQIVSYQNYEVVNFGRGVLMRTWLPLGFKLLPGIGQFFALADALFIFTSSENRCLHDLLAKTIVVYAPVQKKKKVVADPVSST